MEWEIIQALRSQEIIDKDRFLTPREIKKALDNLGFICRKDYLNKELVRMKQVDIIKVKDKSSFRKEYKINKGSWLN